MKTGSERSFSAVEKLKSRDAGWLISNPCDGGSVTITRPFISDIIREEFGLAFRKDLKRADGRYMRGWKGLTVGVAGRG